MAFSSGVKLGDLDDFISPSSECIKPLIEAASAGGGFGSAKIGDTDARGPISAPKVERPNLIKTKKSIVDPKAQIGQVSLSDCLACAGCVTSAETVLLQEQSGEEFLKKAATFPVTVVSISGEARSSLAAHFNVSPLEAIQKVAGGLRQLGATYVLESSASEAMGLLEGEAEFVQRYRNSTGKGKTGQPHSMPLISSHCPGWTCYAEKVVEPEILPHLFELRPPQQIQGRLVKTCLLEAHNRRHFYRWWRSRSPLFAAESWLWVHSQLKADGDAADCKPATPSDVYHVSVQPCFDRKIEAARPHFEAPEAAGVREVDTVLTAQELLDLVQGNTTEKPADDEEDAIKRANEQVKTNRPAAEVWDALPTCPIESEALTDLLLGSIAPNSSGRPAPFLCSVLGANAGSGGFVEHIFRGAAAKLFPTAPVEPALEFKIRQNEDMREVILEDPKTHRVLLKFVSAYGFRNIQNIIRRLTKQGVDPTEECGHFVEIMACPGGCLNGAGLVAIPKGETEKVRKAERREHVGRLENLLHSGDGVAVVPPIEHPLVLPLYQYIAERAAPAEPTSANAKLPPLTELVGGSAVRGFLMAAWKSLKVDMDGNKVVQTSALKW